jgi:methylated-DNA-protein-cysteine methyltransferase related protein
MVPSLKSLTNMPASAYQKIYDVVRLIPIGKVATYGQIADLAGLYGKARLVGYALFQVELESDVPWQRVVNAKGEISYSTAREGGDYLQKNLLEQEGIEFKANGSIDLKLYRWDAPIDLLTETPSKLDELLVNVTPEVIDGEYDWGKSVGKELW